MVGAPQLILLFWCGSQCGLDAVWFVKLRLAARWLSAVLTDNIVNYPKGGLTPGSYRLSVYSCSSPTAERGLPPIIGHRWARWSWQS
jgi:hypothetical protein